MRALATGPTSARYRDLDFNARAALLIRLHMLWAGLNAAHSLGANDSNVGSYGAAIYPLRDNRIQLDRRSMRNLGEARSTVGELMRGIERGGWVVNGAAVRGRVDRLAELLPGELRAAFGLDVDALLKEMLT